MNKRRPWAGGGVPALCPWLGGSRRPRFPSAPAVRPASPSVIGRIGSIFRPPQRTVVVETEPDSVYKELATRHLSMHSHTTSHWVKPRRRIPRSFKELTPSGHFNPRKFFYELVWKAWLTRRVGQHRRPVFPRLSQGKLAVTWIGHASFLLQFNDLNVVIDPNFANWLFLLKRVKRTGLKLRDLPPIDLVLLSHAHFDHFHKATLRKLPSTKIGVMPWGMGDLARGLGFKHIIELQTWDTYTHGDWKVTLTPCKHWGARTLRDLHRGFGGFVIEHQGRRIYHAGDSAYFDGFKEIGRRLSPEVALLPIGAYYPDSFRHVHMGPDEAVRAFHDLRARWLIPMHFGSFKLSFEEMDEPARWFNRIVEQERLTAKVRMLDEGVPHVF